MELERCRSDERSDRLGNMNPVASLRLPARAATPPSPSRCRAAPQPPRSVYRLPPRASTSTAGQSWQEPSISGSQSRGDRLSNTISAKASMSITCCANQTQTTTRKSFAGPTSPPSGSVKEKVKPRLDDGGVGFPPFRFGGGGGGGGGGGSSSSGGFILFVIVLLLDYLREFERNMQNGSRRGGDYDGGLAPQ